MDVLDSPVRVVPVDVRLTLPAGGYEVFERASPPGAPATLTPSDVVVTAPDGRRLETFEAGSPPNTIDAGHGVFSSVVGFDVPADGVYRVTVTARRASTDVRIMIVPTLGTSLKPLLSDGPIWILTGVGSVCLFFIAIVVFVIGLLRWSASRPLAHAPTGAGGPPPGWYPDPWADGHLRFWDGVRWTGARR